MEYALATRDVATDGAWRSSDRYPIRLTLKAYGGADVIIGEAAAQETEDVEWIRLAAERSWIVLCKDDRIRRRPAEGGSLFVGEADQDGQGLGVPDDPNEPGDEA